MKFDDILKNVWFADFEVFAHDWLLVCINYETNEEVIFHNTPRNDVYDWINKTKPILCGHNFAYYDKYILKGILSGFDPEEVKKLNDFIVIGGRQGFEYDYRGEYVTLPPIWDTMQDIVPSKSLKEIEGNLGLDITETTIPFDLPTKWTQEQYEEVLYYCRADVNALRPLFEVRKDYFETKYDICNLCNINPIDNIGITNAKLCAKFLEAKMVKRNDERDYVIPKSINIEYIDHRILEFFSAIRDMSIPSEELFKRKLEFEEHGMPTVVSWGGKHGALPKFKFVQEEEPNMVVINCDFASLYPHLLALPQYNFISRNIKDKDAYANTLKHRLELKKQGKKKEQLALKLILNTTYGCELNQYNDLYDAKCARGTCITGQLLISELTERVFRIGEVELIQVNTDGLMVKLPRTKLEEYYKVCNDFSKNCGIELEYDIITKIIQRDVNNYIMIYGDESHKNIKAKGGCFGGLPKLSINDDGSVSSEYTPDFKQNSLVICAEAIAMNLMFDTPVEETINNCKDIRKFQLINHLGRTYEKMILETPNGEEIELQRNNRIYSGKEKTGKIFKIKPDGRKDSLAMCPTNPIVDNNGKMTIENVNTVWYINYAKQKISDFIGKGEVYMDEKLDKLKRNELIELVKQLKEENGEGSYEITLDESGRLYHKINDLRTFIRNKNFILDKVLPNNLGGGEYVSIEQYYNAIQEGCQKVGLDFSFNVTDVDRFDLAAFKPATGAPQNIATVTCNISLIDIDTGYGKHYTEMSQGSDMLDKAVNGASTLAFRNWFDKNFTPRVFNGEVANFGDDTNTVTLDNVNIPVEQKTVEKPKTFIPTEKKEEIKKDVVATQQTPSNSNDIEELTSLIYEYREKSGKKTTGAKTLKAIMEGTITDSEVLSKTLAFQNALDELGE